MKIEAKIAERVNGETIEKLEEGKLGKEAIIDLLEDNELGTFAWKNRDILKADPRFFCVKLNVESLEELNKVDDTLAVINARMAKAEIRGGNALVLAYDETGFSDWIVDVQNCQGVLKPRKWGVGHKPDLPRGLRWIFIRGVSVPARRELSGREKRKILELLGRFVLLTRSGFYRVEEDTLEKLEEFGVTAER